MSKLEKLQFETDEGVVDFFVLDETRINGCNYLLVADTEDGDGEAMILKDTSEDGSTESVYIPVEDETELNVVADMFEESLGDVEFM